jgi:cysteinyl-tRNA synthetase
MTTLRLFNTLTKTKEDFVPIDPANVRMYVCGPTVYDYAHIGNARPVIVFDVLFRLLRHVYGADHVTYVRNITDVDDKINARAAAEGISIRDLTEKTAQQYLDDVTALGCLPPTVAPRATDHIAGMIAMIEALIKHGNAYIAEGHVLFDVSSKHDYGKLSRRTVDDMIAGARVEIAPYKKNPMDFVMWKPSDAATPGWDSPWGRGRPGWHIECSAMSEKYLGEHFDIHGGGIDLVFPHHENEIAQSEGSHHGRPFANVWMHNGFLEVEGAKMSKSLGNFVTINQLLKDWDGEVLRFNMLRTLYRQPMDWTVAGMKESEGILNRWAKNSEGAPPVLHKEFLDAISDDLNTPKALAWLHNAPPEELAGGMRLLGFSGRPPVDKTLRKDIDEAWLVSQIEARLAARKAKNFKESDRIRDELLAQGIVLKDGPQGTTWEVKK